MTIKYPSPTPETLLASALKLIFFMETFPDPQMRLESSVPVPRNSPLFHSAERNREYLFVDFLIECLLSVLDCKSYVLFYL